MDVLKITLLTTLLITFVIGYVIAGDPDDDVMIFVTGYHHNRLIKVSTNDTVTEETRRIFTTQPWGIAYDAMEEQIYWVERYRGYIKRADTNLQHVTTFLNVSGAPVSLAIDEVSRTLFYTDPGSKVIIAVDLTGLTSKIVLNSSYVYYPNHIIIHQKERKIIWCDRTAVSTISSSYFDGSDLRKIADISKEAYGLAIDEDNDILYWGEYSPPLIKAVSLDGSNKRVIYHHSSKLLDIFLLHGNIYFTSENGRHIHRIPVEGGVAEKITFTTFLSVPFGLYVLPQTHDHKKPRVESRLVHIDDLHSELLFLCTFSQHSEDVFYSTSWFVEENLVLRSDPEKWSNGSVIENQVLTETHLREANITAYGIQISCSVEATYEDGNVSTLAVMSRNKFVGVQVSKTSVRVTQGGSTDIELSLTDPFGCGTLTNVDECRLRVKVNTLRNAHQCDQAVMMPSECGASFVASRWNESVSISLFGKVTSTYGSSSKKVNLNLTSPFNLAHQMWGEALLSQIEVQLTKYTSHIEEKSCYTINDPHLKTFDGRRYEHQYDGNFTFYKHMDFPIEVQIQTARCSYSQNAWCNCGVAVRAGRTVFEINRCPGQSDIWFMDYTLCEDGGDVLQVKRRGSNYDIYLPTGGKVVVNAYGSFLNLQMYPSVQDTEKSAGLCGKMSENGACNDDFVLRDGSYSTDPTAKDGCNAGYRVWVNVLTNFSMSWSVENGNNLFDHSDLSSLSSWPQQKTFCSCSTDKELNDPLQEVDCSADKAHETCKSLPGYSDVIPSKCSINRRRRRSVREAQEAPFHHVHKRNANTWPGNWTEETATEHCEQLFNESKSIQICQNITGGETNSSIDSCILDIKLTGTTDFGKYSVDSVRSKCYHEVVVNPVLQDNDTSSSGNQSVYDIVVAEACPSDCSSNGNCSEGTCYCLPNFGGLDCSVDLSAPPVLSSLHDSHCDTSSPSCDFLSVYGETFTDESTCFVEAFKVRGSGQELEWSRVSTASVQSISHVKCNISVSKELGDTDYVRAFWISVSNDGTLYSNNISVLVYDGSCVTGNINGTDISWTRQDSFCFFGEKCYTNGETRIDDDCKVCIVNGSSTSWENSTASNCTDTLYATTTESTTEVSTAATTEATTEQTGATTQPKTDATTLPTTEATTQPTKAATTLSTPYQEKPNVKSRLIHTDNYHSELVFLCTFSQHSEDVFYSTSWFVEEKLVLRSDPEKWSNGSVIENHVLTETHLREANITTYGIQISCSVEATFEEGNVSTPSVLSRKKFVGIQVSKTSVRVTQGASTDIKLSLTDPFGCGSLTHVDECRLRVKVNTLRKPDLCDQAVMMPSECGASFVALRWNESVSISLFGKVTSTYGSSSKEVNLNLTSTFNWAHKMWGEALLPQIQVQLTKDTSHIQEKSCYSSNDPHLKTFDGRRYEHQYDGNFTFYKHMELPIEVQIQTARCSFSSLAWCNCGAAVRAGRTVFEINRCPGQSDIWFIDYTLCDDGGDVLEVKRRGSYYDIYLPTGGKVVVNAYGSFLNLQMYPSVQDTEKSAGLCGKMSENSACNDDFVLRDGSYSTDPTAKDGCNAGYRVWVNVLTNFSMSWSVENGNNLFDHSDLSSLSSWPQQKTFCSCSTDKELNDPLQEVDCSADKAHETCKSLPGYSDVIPSKCSINRRRRRSVREAQEAPFHHVHKRNANTWPGNWTEETATEHCEQLFNESKSIQICQNITGGETNSSIDSCILDIKLTGTTDFCKYSVDSVRSKCYHEVVVNPVLQDNDTSSSGNQSVYDIVVAEACPSDCSSNGNCSEGTCYCLPNFGGLDCSVDLSAPPVLSSLHDSHCDTSSPSCDFLSVYGETFTDESTCFVEAFKVRGSGQELEWSRVSTASVQSISHVKCNISVSKELGDTDYVRAFWISVSNDGTLYSNNISVLVYDGSCVTGNINGTDISWTRQDSFCFFGEKCYTNGETRIDDNCKVCIVNGSSTSWENSTASNCTDTLYATTTESTTEVSTAATTEATTEQTGATTQPKTDATTLPTTEATTQPTKAATTLSTPYQEKPNVKSRLIHTDNYHSELVFLCTFSQHSEDVFYSTSWFVEEKLVLRSDPEKWSNGSVIENHVLTETHLREANITTYGIQISCSVEATFEEGNVSTPSVLSRKKFVGIQVSKTSVRVTQGASTDIKLSLTDPFGCGSLTHVDECRLRVKVNTLRKPDLCDQAVMMPSECGASFVALRWNESVSISLFGKVTSTYGSSSKEVNLNLTSTFNWAHKMWGEALLPQIQVQLTKDTSHIQEKSCYSSNDPHLKTFDGRRYEHQYDGNFTFYKHMELPIEVQIQTARCSFRSLAWCNCGAAVRAGRTVFEINRCPGQSDIWFIDYTLCDDGGDVLEVKRRGSNYDIYLPTGGKVVVNAYGSFLNLQMYPSVQDTEKSAGLCGKMSENGACNDDFVLRDGSYSSDPTATDGCYAGYRVWVNVLTNFSMSWSVENGNNLFDHSDLSSLSSWPQQKTFCSCSTDKELNDPLQEVECSAGKAHETCKSLPGYSDVTPSKCSINRRRRRSVREAQEAPFHHVHKRNANTWPGNWTEETATEHCEQLFNESKSIQICQNITGGETNSSIDSCILDIKLTGTTDFGKYSVDSVRTKCYHEVVVNPVLQDNGTSSSGNQSVYDIVVAEACPGDCSSNGNCSEGTCYCLPNFGGPDCSVDLSAPPVLSSLHDSHCDTSILSCDFISVYGETFTDESTCSVEAFKLRDTGPELEWSRVSSASVQSISHVKCNISVSKELGDTDYVRAFWISVSNDGTLYSNNVSVLVYDESCVTGNITGTDISWTRQDPFCFYGEKCYINGKTRIDDDCKVCIVNGSSTSWENSTAPNCTDILYATTTESTTEASTAATTEATTEQAGATTQPKTEATTLPTTEATTQPTTDAANLSTTETTTKPTTGATNKPTTERTSQHTTESTTQQTTGASTQTTTEPITEPTTETSTQRTTETSTQPITQPTTEVTTQPTTGAPTQSTTKPTTESTESSSKVLPESPRDGTTVLTTELSTEATTADSSTWTTEDNTLTTKLPVSDRSKMDFNTVTALSVAGGIVAFAVLVAIISFITIKVGKMNDQMKESRPEKADADQDDSWTPDHSSRLDNTQMPGRWSVGRKFISTPYMKRPDFGHI